MDLPVGGRGQRDPGDLSCVVAAVNTTEDHLTALVAVAKRVKNKSTYEHNVIGNDTHVPKDFHSVSVPAQVDREHGLGHQSLLDHVVENRHDVVRGNGLEGQSQDAISLHASHKRSLCLAKAKNLVCHRDAAHLDKQDSCQSQFNRPQGYACLKSK